MSQAISPHDARAGDGEAGYERLIATLGRAASQRRRAQRWTRLRFALAWWLMLLLLLMMVDVLWPASETGRTAMLAVLLLAGIGLAIATWRSSRSSRGDVLRAAGDLEAHHRLDDNPLVNAWWLGKEVAQRSGHQTTDDFVTALEIRSLMQGVRLAGMADGESLEARRTAGTMDSRRLLWLVLGLWLAVAVLLPRLPLSQLPRIVLPWGDLPSFSLTQLKVSLPDEPVAQGRDASVGVTCAGQPPGQLAVLVLDEQGRAAARLPMTQTGPRSFRATLAALSRKTRIRIVDEQASTRTRAMTIRVQPWPPSKEPVAQRPHEEASPVSDSRSGDPLQQRLESLARQAQAISQQAGTMADAMNAGPDSLSGELPGEFPGKLSGEALEAAMAAFKQQADAFRQQVQGESRSSQDAQAMEKLAQLLGSLDLPGKPTPGQLARDDAAATLQCLGDICAAAKADLEKLAQYTAKAGPGLGRSHDDAGSLSRVTSDEPARLPDDDAQGLRQGTYDAAGESRRGPLLRTDARMKQVPEIYRGKAADYFDRINQQSSQTP